MASSGGHRRRGKRGRHLEACEGAVGRGDGARGHELRDTLGLGEVEAAVEEGAQRELPRGGEAAARGEAEVQHTLRRHAAAVAVHLDDIFARVGARAQHRQQQDLVDGAARSVHDVAVVDAVGGWLEGGGHGGGAAGRPGAEELGAEGDGVWAGQADDGDRAAVAACTRASAIVHACLMRRSGQGKGECVTKTQSERQQVPQDTRTWQERYITHASHRHSDTSVH